MNKGIPVIVQSLGWLSDREDNDLFSTYFDGGLVNSLFNVV